MVSGSLKLRELLARADVGAEIRGDAILEGISYDSRAVARGDLYCCIPGERADGHLFAADAVAGGASALLVERWLDVDVAQARVGRVRAVLGRVAAACFGRPSDVVPVAAVTGTNGKTTVTYLIESIARAAGVTPGVIGTVSIRIGDLELPAVRTTPESVDVQRLLARMRDDGVGLVAMEATSDGLEQGRLDGTRFVSAGFTNLTQDHLSTHGSMDAYFEAKALLFERRFTDHAVINAADPYGRRLLDRIDLDVLTYGTPGSDIACEHLSEGRDRMDARVRTRVGTFDVTTRLMGRFNVDNCLCAFGLALHLGITPAAIVEGIRRVERVPGRLEPVDAGQDFRVLVDYAHTPDALAHVVRSSRDLADGRLIVVFGCGGDRDRGKRPLMAQAATRVADLTIITSDNPRSEDPGAIIDEIVVGAEGPYKVEADRRAAIALALEQARAGDVVLIAGKGHETGQQFRDRTIPFDDREVARELLEAGA